jgi:hypothetical protein
MAPVPTLAMPVESAKVPLMTRQPKEVPPAALAQAEFRLVAWEQHSEQRSLARHVRWAQAE